MQAAHLDELIALEDSYWWHVAKRELAVSLLKRYAPAPGRLVEGGIGSARNLQAFRELGYQVSGLDIMPQAVSHARQRGLNATVHDLEQPWPLDANAVKAVVLLDVIEHVSDPVAVLSHAREALAAGGGVVVTVPAYQWLFGDWDQSLGHYRRYTRQLLKQQAEAAGLRVLKLAYWNSCTLPAAVAVRGCQRVLPAKGKADFPRVSEATNRWLLRAAAVERWMLRRCDAPCGLSVVGVFGK